MPQIHRRRCHRSTEIGNIRFRGGICHRFTEIGKLDSEEEDPTDLQEEDDTDSQEEDATNS